MKKNDEVGEKKSFLFLFFFMQKRYEMVKNNVPDNIQRQTANHVPFENGFKTAVHFKLLPSAQKNT